MRALASRQPVPDRFPRLTGPGDWLTALSDSCSHCRSGPRALGILLGERHPAAVQQRCQQAMDVVVTLGRHPTPPHPTPRHAARPQDEPSTPIKQDTKKGKLRFYPYNINWYGAWHNAIPAVQGATRCRAWAGRLPTCFGALGGPAHKRRPCWEPGHRLQARGGLRNYERATCARPRPSARTASSSVDKTHNTMCPCTGTTASCRRRGRTPATSRQTWAASRWVAAGRLAAARRTVVLGCPCVCPRDCVPPGGGGMCGVRVASRAPRAPPPSSCGACAQVCVSVCVCARARVCACTHARPQ